MNRIESTTVMVEKKGQYNNTSLTFNKKCLTSTTEHIHSLQIFFILISLLFSHIHSFIKKGTGNKKPSSPKIGTIHIDDNDREKIKYVVTTKIETLEANVKKSEKKLSANLSRNKGLSSSSSSSYNHQSESIPGKRFDAVAIIDLSSSVRFYFCDVEFQKK
ncbi:hypothetical protein DERF_012492 [Dermatophagoides farinae]|uniref:Uncharacterized protein n=1 Tax=Dermatophagoides farinae TaxID=6954 RepID=A0A922HSN5_DERFA|nr:hypothetical protein DERF_012492 [Dermatophagoides farinae]